MIPMAISCGEAIETKSQCQNHVSSLTGRPLMVLGVVLGLGFMAQQTGDPYYIATVSVSFFTPLPGGSGSWGRRSHHAFLRSSKKNVVHA